jgi:serine/threonine protein phosphatase PrpC
LPRSQREKRSTSGFDRALQSSGGYDPRRSTNGFERDSNRRSLPSAGPPGADVRARSAAEVQPSPNRMPAIATAEPRYDGSRSMTANTQSLRDEVRLRVGADTVNSRGKGYHGNQDRFVHRNGNGEAALFAGVFDGHGVQGDKVAEYAKDCLSKEVLSRVSTFGPERALSTAFESTSKQLEGRKDVATYSGTTAVTALFPDPTSILVANCGDSRAVLGRRVGHSGKLQAVDLSRDHTPGEPDERKRIENLKGRVHQTMVPVGGSAVPMGPERVWDKTGMCGLGVSRSLGDLHMAPFVSQLPEITQKKLDASDRVVILASDGVWGQMSSQQAVEIAGKHTSPTKAAQEITQVCRQRWLNETGSRMCDDITAVVVNIDGQTASGDDRGASSMTGSRKSYR